MKVAKQGFVEKERGREGEEMQGNHLTGALSGEFLTLKICGLHTLASSSRSVRNGGTEWPQVAARAALQIPSPTSQSVLLSAAHLPGPPRSWIY